MRLLVIHVFSCSAIKRLIRIIFKGPAPRRRCFQLFWLIRCLLSIKVGPNKCNKTKRRVREMSIQHSLYTPTVMWKSLIKFFCLKKQNNNTCVGVLWVCVGGFKCWWCSNSDQNHSDGAVVTTFEMITFIHCSSWCSSSVSLFFFDRGGFMSITNWW